MKKHTMLGVNSNTQSCCKLTCLVSFDNLIPEELEENDFVHEATNWNGQDDIDRTLGILNMKQTGKKIVLSKPLQFTGVDHDMGHIYSWRFVVDEIHELVE